MENTKKIILALFIATLASCNQKDEYTLIKENLYETTDDQIVMKFLNKNVNHPSKDNKWKDTIYQSHFRYESIDSVVPLKDIIDIKAYKIIAPDTYFEDENHIYINAHYEPGENQFKVIKKDSLTFFINKDTLKTISKTYYKGNVITQ
ncbi:hypothetical protein [Winogradskyella sp. 3972H.M.0a.05]|uniref:hypothetical protein n=1 Tax=Winogradskyella sp. 3972H.M.0a.05 TaxID=2950277 RepID=UPI0033909EB8